MTSHTAVAAQLHPPTGVTHCISAYLTHPPGLGYGPTPGPLPNLVLARSTCLEVYTVRQPAGSQESKLELVSRSRLYGVVESLAVLKGRAGRGGLDAILLAFRDAKLSVLCWDAEHHGLAPSSLHYFEGDESLKGGRAAFPRPPLAAADPAGRCAAVVMFRQQLGVLPAMESEAAALGVAADELYGNGAAGGSAGTASVGNSYVDNLRKMGITEVRDAVFLHGYNEPVLLVLHEGDATWAGNLRLKKDTCMLSALSLNLSAKRHPRIWHAQGLPADAYRLLPAPSGGALVLCLNIILYYSQASHAGVVVNTAALPAPALPPPLAFDMSREAPGETAAKYARAHANELHPDAAAAAVAFCDASQAGWDVECDAAHAAWVNPTTALVGLRSGQLVLVQVVRLGGGGVKIRVARAGAGPPASCMTALSPSIVFVGSLAGDSLLVGCNLQTERQGGGGSSSEPDAKRRRLESADADQSAPAGEDGAPGSGAPAAAEPAAADGGESDEEALLYGAALDAGSRGAADLKCSLQVLDSLVGIGPLRSMTAGIAAGNEAPYLLACCGSDRSGALAVLRQSVAPDVLTEVPLPGIRGAWAVRHSSAAQQEGASQVDGASFHAYLLLSFEGSTKVLATGAELQEVTDLVEFAVDTATIAAGSLCEGRRILQAFPEGLRLLDGAEQRQELWAAELVAEAGQIAPSVAAVHIEDPFVLVQLSDGRARLLEADPATNLLKLGAQVPAGAGGTAAVTSCCLYRDECGWLGRQLPPAAAAAAAEHTGADGIRPAAGGGVYGVVVYSDGSLAMWALPDLQEPPVWRCAALAAGSKVLLPSAHSSEQLVAPGMGSALPSVVEVRMESFGAVAGERPDLGGGLSSTPVCEAPVLVALTSEHTLLTYKAFSCNGAGRQGPRSPLRFARLPLDVPPLLPPAPSSSAAAALPQRLVRFVGVGEEIPCSGIFVAGAFPQWLVASRGSLVPHPMHLPQGAAATGFTPFHNANCPHGFITACSGARSAIQISQLPRRQRMDAPWPRQKVAIKATPLRVCLYAEAGLFALLTARQAPARPFLREEEGGEPQASYAYALAGAAAQARGTMEQHELRLVLPGSWATLWRYALLPGEQALAVEPVHIRDTTTGGTVPLLAVGAGFSAGEDYPCSGRVLLFEVKRGAAGGGDAAWGAQLVYSREFKGPVTALSTLEGYLLLATGNRLETCALSTTAAAYKLQRTAFYDGPMLVTTLSVVKGFVLLGDAQHSAQFVRYRDEGKQLGLLSKDFGKAPVRAAQFLIAGSSLHVVAADGAGTLRAFTYAPNDPGSWKGQKLLNWGVFHVGDRAVSMLRARMPAPDEGDNTPRQGVLVGTDAGGLCILMPLAVASPLTPPPRIGSGGGSDAAAALKALQGALVTGVEHAAGLNPAAFRRRYARIPASMEGGQPYGKQLPLAGQGILDGDLLLSYAHLPWATQLTLAQRAGVEREQVMQALSSIARTSLLF